jgi:ankyrin repeat protein
MTTDGHDGAVAALLQAGADANRALRTASYSKGVTPLYMAARNGWAKVAMLLLGARADPELARDADGSVPLTTAATSESFAAATAAASDAIWASTSSPCAPHIVIKSSYEARSLFTKS